MQQVSIVNVRGLPMYGIPYRNALRCGFERILGFKLVQGQALFPAFAPFGDTAANDIRLVFPDAAWSAEATTAEEAAIATRQFVEASETEATLPEALTNLDFVLPPFNHQREALIRAYLYPRTALLLDCGLGKTKVSIDLLRACKHVGEEVRAIVLAPSGLIVANWGREITKHGPELSYRTSTTPSANLLSKARRAKMYAEMKEDPPNVFVTTYGALANDGDAIRRAFPHNFLICDESHGLQTPTSKRTAIVREFADCPRRILLTGTASQGSPDHMYGQLAVLAPWLVGELWDFKHKFSTITYGAMCKKCFRRYEEIPFYSQCTRCKSTSVRKQRSGAGYSCRSCDAHYAIAPRVKGCTSCKKPYLKRIPFIHGYRNLSVLNTIVSRVSLRRTAEACLDLPPLRTIDIPYTLPAAARKAYNALVNYTAGELLNGKTVSSPSAAQRILRLLQILGGYVRADSEEEAVEGEAPPKGEMVRIDPSHKIAALTDLLDSIFSSDDSKVIIWGHFTESLNIAEEVLQKLDIGYVRIDGKTKHRETLRAQFETDPKCRIYLGQIQTGIGIDLVAANYMIYWDLPFFNWSHYEQSIKRMHRIGQKRPSTVYRLNVPGSIHDYVLDVLAIKDGVVQSLISRNLCALCRFNRTCREKGIHAFDIECHLASNSVSKTKASLATI